MNQEEFDAFVDANPDMIYAEYKKHKKVFDRENGNKTRPEIDKEIAYKVGKYVQGCSCGHQLPETIEEEDCPSCGKTFHDTDCSLKFYDTEIYCRSRKGKFSVRQPSTGATIEIAELDIPDVIYFLIKHSRWWG